MAQCPDSKANSFHADLLAERWAQTMRNRRGHSESTNSLACGGKRSGIGPSIGTRGRSVHKALGKILFILVIAYLLSAFECTFGGGVFIDPAIPVLPNGAVNLPGGTVNVKYSQEFQCIKLTNGLNGPS